MRYNVVGVNTMTNIRELTDYCLSCPRPRCETGCPTGNHIRDFIKYLKEDDLAGAAHTLYDVNPFPELTSRLCDCERQCQGHCVRGIKGEPVSIQEIERYISDQVKRDLQAGDDCGKKAALLGAGPACLAAAIDLRKAGFTVDIYEKLDSCGGAILSGIPAYRFDKAYLVQIEKELKEIGVNFHFRTEVGKDISTEELLNTYDCVLAGIGAQVENTYGLHASQGCEAGLDLLYNLNILGMHEDYKKKYKGAVVWGGGNVAMDCARSLIRILDEVTVIYRRSRAEMPANRDEIEDAINEGVRFAFLENIKELITDEQGRVTGARCVKMELGEPDESGRRSTHEIPGSEYEISCELVVPAIGQKVSLACLGADVHLTEGHQTDIPKVYVCGDARLGPKTVAAAIRDGREAASEIISALA